MKFGIDVSDLSTNRADGTTRYTRELAKRLPSLSPQDSWHYFAPSAVADSWSQNVTFHTSPWPKYWTQARLPWELLRVKPDVLLMPIQQLPILRPSRMKTVAVIHDLAVHKYPEQFRTKDWLLLQAFSAQVAHQADAIIADSQATADDIAYYYQRTKHVHVVHLGVDHTFFKPQLTPQPRPSTVPAAPYILFVGQIQPRKNLIRLIEAFELVQAKQPELQLVIAGGHGWLQQPIMRRVEQSAVKTHIKLLGRVSDELLRQLYWHAEVFVLPSLYEGFGIPLLEAMAAGCPVVTTNVSSMPEVVGKAGILIDPTSVESLAAGIEQAQAQGPTLRQLGIEQAARFTWERSATQTLTVLQSVYG